MFEQYKHHSIGVFSRRGVTSAIAITFTKRLGMDNNRVFNMPFARVYPLYVAKAERKGRSKEEVDAIIFWLTGYDARSLDELMNKGNTLQQFFDSAPLFHPNADLIKGVICGHRVEEIADPLMQKIRYLDKLIDELAQGKKLEKILRQS